MEIMITLFL